MPGGPLKFHRLSVSHRLPPSLLHSRAGIFLGPQFATRGIVIQRRYLLGPIFRAARSGFSLAAGAAAGGIAYTDYKFRQASNSASETFGQAKEWLQGMWDKIPDMNSSDEASSLSSVSESLKASQGTRSDGDSASDAGGAGGSEGQGGPGNEGGSSGGGQSITAAIINSSVVEDDKGNESDNDEDTDQVMINLTRKMIEIRSILAQIDGADSVQLPSIVVIGSQSSGKSSVLEAIVGHEFLPKGSNMVTRRPIELTLIHTPGANSEYCELPVMRTGAISDFREVQRILTNLNKAVPAAEVVSDEPIQLRVYSPHVPDLTMIDLPGYIQVVAADQPLELKSRISQLCDKYIQAPNIILAVSAADVDLANSTALKSSRRVDPDGERTIGVITKLDLVDPERGRSIILNREYPLKMGYVGVVTRNPNSIFPPSNLTATVAKSEKAFFNKPTFVGLDCGVIKLRKKLMRALESSMSRSLVPVTLQIRKELEETSYQFKVQYNDRVLTPQSYLARSADAFKVGFQEMTASFGREQIRDIVKGDLDQKILDILAERYWNSPLGAENPSNDVAPQFARLENVKESESDILAWQARLDQTTAALTKLGIGRMSAQLLVDAVTSRMDSLIEHNAFRNHPLAIEAINEATQNLLVNRFYATADQIENSIKPYKYEVDIDSREWIHSREHSYHLLKEELRQCEGALERLKESIGAPKLKRLMASLDNNTQAIENLDHFSSNIQEQAKLARFLRDRSSLLQARIAFVRSPKCRSRRNKALCPEVFLDAVSDKLTSTAVLFLNFEMLSDFYYSFPRELDAKLGALSEHDVATLATQDPRIKRHIDLQRRRELLQLALNKLQTIRAMQKNI